MKYFFYIWTQPNKIFNEEEKFFFLKIDISIGENWLNKKNYIKHKYSVFFEIRNNNSTWKIIKLQRLVQKLVIKQNENMHQQNLIGNNLIIIKR